MEGIRKFQDQNGLKNDGITEKNTFKLLKQKYEELNKK